MREVAGPRARKQRGLTSIEYSLLAALIAVVSVAALTTVGQRTLDLYELVCDGVARATGRPAC